MKTLRLLWLIVTLALLGYGFHVAMDVVPPDAAMFNVQRIFYYHIPSWVAISLCFGANLVGSVVYLVARNRRPALALRADARRPSDRRNGRCLLPGRPGHRLALGALCLGHLVDMGRTPHLDPHPLAYLCQLSAARNFSAGPQMRTVSAVLAIFGYIDVPIVYMSTRWWRTQHPAPVIAGAPGTGLDPSMMPAVSWNLTHGLPGHCSSSPSATPWSAAAATR